MKTPNPSRSNVCPCGMDVYPNALSVKEHKAKHLDWLASNQSRGFTPSRGFVPTLDRITAWRAYATELEGANARLREDINVFLDRIEDLNAQLDAIHRQETQ